MDDQLRAGGNREQRLRRLAKRKGLRVVKSRYAMHYGTYMVIDPYTNSPVAWRSDTGYGLDLDEVEAFLNDE